MSDATISSAALRIVKLLIGNRPQSVGDLIRATGVTRTAVTEQLSELTAAGFVERSTEKLESRGRPRHLYRATDAAMLLLFARHESLVVPAIWHAIREVGGEKLAADILKCVSRAMVEHYTRKITAKKTSDRVRQFVDLLTEEGSLLEAVECDDGRWTIYRRSCPFMSMFEQHRTVCQIDKAVLSAVAGREVSQTACRHDGAACCEFTLRNGSP